MIGKTNFSDEFKRDAVVQISERGYPLAEVSPWLGPSPHSLYAWKRQFAKVVSISGDAGKDTEIPQLKRDLARVTEERDTLKSDRVLHLHQGEDRLQTPSWQFGRQALDDHAWVTDITYIRTMEALPIWISRST